jgi:hypothetical protein
VLDWANSRLDKYNAVLDQFKWMNTEGSGSSSSSASSSSSSISSGSLDSLGSNHGFAIST